jgi:hypothetical protein
MESLDVTGMLVKWGQGDKNVLNQLLPAVYDELHRMAGRYLHRIRNPLMAYALMELGIGLFAFGFPIVSREQPVWQELAAQAHKLAFARGEIEPAEAPRIANSVVDRTAAYGRGTDANAFIHGQLRTGFRRGGTTRRLPSGR